MDNLDQNKFQFSSRFFDEHEIRVAFHEESVEWYFSVIDVITALEISKYPRRYWSDLKSKFKKGSNELYEKIVQLKMRSSDGKFYKTDVCIIKYLKIICSQIPLKKTESFLFWLNNFDQNRLPIYQINLSQTIDIKNYIQIIRGTQVILDQDVAMLFGVETKRVLEQVRRNPERFPEDFMFELKREEMLNLRPQIATSSWGGSRYKRFAFTEYGIAQLSSVLNSETAVQMSILIMRAFVAMRNLLLSKNETSYPLGYLSKEFYTFKNEVDTKFKIVFETLEKNKLPEKTGIFFENSIFDAHELICSFIREAEESIILIDNYMDETVLKQLSKKKEDVNVTLYSQKIKEDFRLDVSKFQEQYPSIQLFMWTKSHDRFMIIDRKIGYDIGASLKDAGKKWFGINRCDSFVPIILKELDN